MKPNELRVGNWVNNNEENYQITSATIIQLERGDSTAKPIELSDEWIKRLGFEILTDKNKGFKTTSYSHTKIPFVVYWDGVRLSTGFWQGNEKRYVHELQNLFYALSGQGLELSVVD